jgi:hypothetical protein
LKTLGTGQNISVTGENADPISLLAREFCLDELLSECITVHAPSAAELAITSSESVTESDNQTFSKLFGLAQKLKESIAPSISPSIISVLAFLNLKQTS